MINLDAIGGFGAPRLLIAGDTARSPAAGLVRTAAIRVLEQSGDEPLRARAVRQLLDLGFPFTLGEQGPFVARGIPAVTLTTVPDGPSQGFADIRLSGERLGELGRATQNLVGSLDAGLELTQGTTSYVYLGSRIVRGWAIEFVLLTALLPFLIGVIDLFARCRRRRIALTPAARSLRTRLLFWGYAGLLLFVAARLGAFPAGEPRPLPPDAGVYEPSPIVLERDRHAAPARLAARPRTADSPAAGDAGGDARRPHGRSPRARPRRARRRRDQPLLARLPAPVAVRLALAAPGARSEPGRSGCAARRSAWRGR